MEETSDPAVKLFELIEQADDGAGIGDCPQTICLPFELSPPEQVFFLFSFLFFFSQTICLPFELSPPEQVFSFFFFFSFFANYLPSLRTLAP